MSRAHPHYFPDDTPEPVAQPYSATAEHDVLELETISRPAAAPVPAVQQGGALASSMPESSPFGMMLTALGRGASLDLVEKLERVRVLVRRHLEREALVHGVGHGKAVELGAHDLEHRNAATGRQREHLFDALVHLEARRDVERRGGDARAERFEHRVAAGHDLAVVAGLLLRARRSRSVGQGADTGLADRPLGRGAGAAARGGEAFLGGLALAGGVVRAVFGLRRGLLALEGLAALPARADLLPLAALTDRPGAPLAFS